MRVNRYEAHNIMRAEDIDFDLTGRHLYLVGGRNEQGKTSALMALLMALCGRSGMSNYPEVALRDGEDRGWVKVELSGDSELHEDVGFTIELYLLRAADDTVVEEFRVLDSTGEPAPEPRTLLKRLYDMRAFDPLEFERISPADRKKLIKKLLGLDFTASRKEYDETYAERTLVNRDGVQLKGVLDGLPKYDNSLPQDTVDVSEVSKRLEEVGSQNLQITNATSGLVDQKKLHTAAITRRGSYEREIERLQKLIKEEDVTIAGIDAEMVRLREIASRPQLNSDELRKKIEDAAATNRRIVENNRVRVETARLEELRKQSAALSAKLAEIEDYERARMEAAPWPVPGMSFSDDDVAIDGLPFGQACRSKRIKASARVGMALNPKLRLMVSQDGSDLDVESLRELDSLLREWDGQLIMEIVTRTAADEELCSVVVSNGKSSAPNVAFPAASESPKKTRARKAKVKS